jgi:ABC-type Fe2+-enterobactin transport system substrate-binding protein
VVQPRQRSSSATVREVATQVRSTLQPYDPQQQHNSKSSSSSSLLSKAANKLTSRLPFKLQHPKDALTRRGEQERRRQRQELTRDVKDALRPFPWPFRAFGNTMANTVNRVWTRESAKAEVLIADAQSRICSDRDARTALGEPITTGRIFSQSVSTSSVNGTKSTKIQISFEVMGSHKSGVATMLADKYARGHIVALRVRVAGITYDIDV